MSSARPRRGRRNGGIRAAGLAALVGLLASGCATLPGSGPITKVQDEDEGASQVEIWPSPPSPDETSSEIVSGFLEAARSGASNQRIAADYLMPAIQGQWRSDQNTVIVLADYTEDLLPSSGNGTQDGAGVPPDGYQAAGSASDSAPAAPVVEQVQVQGAEIGLLDSQGLYSAQSGAATFQFSVVETKAGYRIAVLPQDFGVLMERSDFESSYSRHVAYYENPQQTGDFVPTEIYLPTVDTDDEVAQQMARLIVSRVPARLSPAMQDPAPAAAFVNLDLDGNGAATVTIKGNGACAKSENPCDELAQQLAQSLGGLSAKVSSVAVADESTGLNTGAFYPAAGLAGYGLGEQGPANQDQDFYAVSPGGTLEVVNTSGTVPTADVSFGAGTDKLRFEAVAVAPGSETDGQFTHEADGQSAVHLALLGQNGYTVYVAHQEGSSETLDDVFPGTAAPPGGVVRQLAWDSDIGGALWFTYTVAGQTSVYRYYGGELSQVTVAGLPQGGVIDKVSPAPDGDRVAIGYVDQQGADWIKIGAAVPQNGGGYAVDLGDSEVAAAAWNSITEFDWYNEDSLAVLGIPASSQDLGLYQLYADGSPVYDTLTAQPVQASPPSQAGGFVWNAGGQPIATAPAGQNKDTLYTLSVEGQEAQPLSGPSGISPSY